MFRTLFKKEIFTKISKFRISAVLHQNKRCGSNYQNRPKKLILDCDSGFYLAYQKIKEELLDDQLFYYTPSSHIRERYSKCIDYICIQDQVYLTNSVIFMHAYKYFEKPTNLTKENLKKMIILAWCLRLLDSAIIVADDIVDNQHVRYGKPTWMEIAGGKEAMMDANFLETSVTYLLIRYFANHPQFVNILREFTITHSAICISTMLDTQKYKLEEFEDNDNYVKSYGVAVPAVMCAMYVADIDKDLQARARMLTMEISHHAKMEDDFIGAFRPISTIEKESTDVAEGRITWMAVHVAKYGTPSQKKIISENYGKKDESATAKVHDLYKEMNLEEWFYEYEEKFYEDINQKIQDMPSQLPKKLFEDLLNYAVLHGLKS